VFGRIFDSPVQLLIIVLIIVLLFGAKRLPDAARGVGRSLRIFKSEVKQMQDDDKPASAAQPSPAPEPLEGRVVDEPSRSSTPADRRTDT
jgi:sec-independent protein translocase protein TatA